MRDAVRFRKMLAVPKGGWQRNRYTLYDLGYCTTSIPPRNTAFDLAQRGTVKERRRDTRIIPEALHTGEAKLSGLIVVRPAGSDDSERL